MTWQVMPEYSRYSTARKEFVWDLPEEFNPARNFLRDHDRINPESRTALIDAVTGTHYTFTDLDMLSGRLASGFIDMGIEKGDRIAIIAPQRVETPITHIAAWKIGAVSIPMTTMYGPAAIEHRLSDSEADAVVFDPSVKEAINDISLDSLETDVAIQLSPCNWYVGKNDYSDKPLSIDPKCRKYQEVINSFAPRKEIIDSKITTDSTIMYTSGSTGSPKGVVHGHGLWLGRAAAAYNFFDGSLGNGEIMWTPADWAWASALGALLMGSWHYGETVVAAPMKGFNPDMALSLCEEYDITNALIPPTGLRMLMDLEQDNYNLSLQRIASAGEPLTPEILDWADQEFPDLTINEYYGQTELNLVIANSSRWFEIRPGSMGKPLPGYRVKILDPQTYEELPSNEVGEIAVRPNDDRVFFKQYLNRPRATENKCNDGWYLTGDLASMDENGYIWFESRADDVIITSGYRVGPVEIEQVLLKHPQVEQAGVVGIPDEQRGEIIKAFIELTQSSNPSDKLRSNLQDFAQDQLAKHEYPREIEFVDSLPMTSSGKIQRSELRPNS